MSRYRVPLYASEVTTPLGRLTPDGSGFFQPRSSVEEQYLRSIGADVVDSAADGADALSTLFSGRITSAVAGWKVGIGPGASRDARNHVEYKCSIGNYTRKNGLVTAILTSTTPRRWFPGKVIQFRAQNAPEVEGTFQLLSCTIQAGVSSTLTWKDARADSAGDVLSDMVIADVASYSLCNAYLQSANMCTGGKCDFWVGATGSTNANDWDDARIYNRLTKFGDPALGQTLFDVIVWPGGAAANNYIRIYNGNPVSTQDNFAALTTRIEAQITHLLQYTRFLILKIEGGSRNLDPSNQAYTLASMMGAWYYNYLLPKYRCVYIAQEDQLLGSNYQDPALPLDSDVANNFPPYEWLYDDGTHANYPGRQRIGGALGLMLNRILGQLSPDLGTMALGRPENSVSEPGGQYQSLVNTGRFGNAALKGSPDIGAGSQPTNTTVAVTTPGSATLVQSVEADPEGGWNWKIQVTDAAGSAQGVGLTAALQSPGGDTWVNILNDVRNQGKRLKGLLPFDINWTNEGSVKNLDISLFGTVGGQEYHLGSMESDEGSYSMGSSGSSALTRGSIVSGGTGYTVGDQLSVVGGTKSTTAKIQVTKVVAGVITRFKVYQPGQYTVTPSNNVSVTGGTGTGATFALNWRVIFRTMDWGFSGNLTFPKDVVLPTGVTFTAAELRIAVSCVPSVGTGVLTMKVRAGERHDCINPTPVF